MSREGNHARHVIGIFDHVDAGRRDHDGVELEVPAVAGPVVGDQALPVQVERVEGEFLGGDVKLEDDLAGFDAGDQRRRRFHGVLVEQLQDRPSQ